MPGISNGLSKFFLNQRTRGGGRYTCTSKQIANAWKQAMQSFGYTIGSMTCALKYIDPLTANTPCVSPYNCSTDTITSAWKAQMESFGYTIPGYNYGSYTTYMQCASEYLNQLTDSSEAGCIATQWDVAMNKLGYVVGDSTCTSYYLKTQVTGEAITTATAYCDTMEEDCDTIDFLCDSEWYNTIV